MAVILNISDGTTTVNLANTTGPELENNYLPAFAEPTGDGTIPPDVTEALPVLVHIATDDGLAATLQDIARLSEQARLYMANQHQTPVWFNRKLTAESGGSNAGIRYLVKSLTFTPNARFGGLFDVGPAITDGRIGVIAVTHHPYGEAITPTAASGTDDVSVLGGATNYTDVVGDVPARPYFIHIDDLLGARVYRQFWMGFRSDSRAGGDASRVATVWELEAGSVGVDTATADVAGGSPTGGGGANNVMQCDFAGTATWASRCTLIMNQIAAITAGPYYGNQVGAYVALLRAKVNAGVAQVYLRSGINTSVVYRRGPVVDISDTAWNFYNLGTVEWPTRSLHAAPTGLFAATYDQQDGINVYGRVKPGETAPDTLDMDCVVLIPADEYFIHVQSAEVTQAVDDELYVTVSPEDVAEALTIDGVGNMIDITAPISVIGAGIPAGDGRLFICVANDNDGTAPAYNDDVDVELRPIPRWVYFRGAE